MTLAKSFTGIYVESLRELITCLPDAAFRLFAQIATYIDRVGKCWPGIRELSTRTGMRPNDVIEVLQYLESIDLVRCLRRNAHDPVTGQKQPNVYVVNPNFVVVSSPIISCEQWSYTLLQNSEKNCYITTTITTSNKPIHEVDPETTTNNHNFFEGGSHEIGQVEPEKKGQPEDDITQSDLDHPQRAQPPARSAKQPTAPNGAKPHTPLPPSPLPPRLPDPPPHDLSAYAKPLALESDESAAHAMLAATGHTTTIAWARYYTETYGARTVALAVKLLAMQPEGEVQNPAGWLVAQLRRKAVGTDSISTPTRDGKRYITGKHAEFIEH